MFHAWYVKKQSRLHELQYLFWECTNRCNMACLHCGSDCKMDASCPDMPLQDFLHVCKQVASYYHPSKVMIVLTGGEPLLRSDLEEFGREVTDMGFSWGMVTNGLLLTPERLNSLLNVGLNSITISLDGFKDEHEWLRGVNGSFDHAVEAVKLVTQASQLTYDVVTCVNQRNIKTLTNFRNFLFDIRVRYWRLFAIDPIGRAKEQEELFLTRSQLHSLLDFIEKERNKGKIHVSFGCDGFLGKYEAKVRDYFFFCRAGIHVGSVLSNGDIGACPNIDRGFVQGNIYRDNFIEVWQKKFDIYRNRKKKGICKDCSVWTWCRGDGMHLHVPGHENPVFCYFRYLFM
ncbi:MAG: TIGR04133 family radical SAM/SPASM protein [Bacteroidales bacterium]|nr:TIGR04133 family radical SAM/SPASM protein [Bacteroidales bacterium]